MSAKTANRVAVVVYDSLALFEFSVACEIFGPAEVDGLALDRSWYQCVVCGDAETVRCDNGLVLQVPSTLTALRRADLVVLPPCDDPWQVSEATLAAVRRAHARGARIVSLCTGAFVLARTGLLDGRTAVTHWNDCLRLAAEFPAVTMDPSVLYVDEGDILTSAGSAASIDLCLHIVRGDYGASVANRLARQLVVQPHRDGGQAQYIDAPMPVVAAAEPFADTLAWMTAHLDEDLTIADLAERTATSPRSFARHFAAATGSTPYQWLLRQRIAQAQRLLETTDLAVDVVAERVGLTSAANLRKHFRRQLDTNPQAYRRAFRAAG